MGITGKLMAKIMVAFNAGYTCAEIAEGFGLPESVVRRICLDR